MAAPPVRRMPPPSANERAAPPAPSPEIVEAMKRQQMEQAARAQQVKQRMQDAETAKEVRAAVAAKKAEEERQLQQKTSDAYNRVQGDGMKKGGKIGKYQRFGSNTRKFAAGGAADDELSLDGLSLSEARNVARNMVEMNGDPSLKHFTWRGQKYAINPGPARAAPKASQESTSGGPPTRARRAPPSSEDQFAAFRARNPDLQQEPGLEQVTPEMWGVGGAGKALAGLAGAGLTAAGARYAAPRMLKALANTESKAEGKRQMANVMSRSAEKEAARKGAENSAEAIRAGLARSEAASARRTRGLAERMRQERNRERIAESPGIIDRSRAPSDADLSGVIGGYKRGGVTKKYARGGGIESKGKTKGKFR